MLGFLLISLYANRSIDISQYFIFGTQILISKFHLNYVIFKNEILQNMKQFQVINFNLSKYEGSRN